MKLIKYLRNLSIFILLWLVSCIKPVNPTLPHLFSVSVLMGTHVQSYQLREIDYDIDLAVFKGDNTLNSIVDYQGMPDSAFSFGDYDWVASDGTIFKHTFEKIEYRDTSVMSTFSTLILIDQSASPKNFNTWDSLNRRFEAYNAFYRNLKGQGKAAFAWFSRTGTGHDVVNYINNDFSSDWDENTALALLDLTHKQSGTSGLYDAIERAVIFVASKNLENPSVTVFVKNKDDGLSDISLDNLIYLANQSHVRINVIWLMSSGGVDWDAFGRLSTETGGFSLLLYLDSFGEFSTTMIRLPSLLMVATHYYKISVRFTATGPGWFATQYKDGMYCEIYDPVSKYYELLNFIPIRLEKP